ncbi:MAG: cytochrome c biogenesis protein ResB [Verrucomicrobia bacterium]|nr:cytochrome c biogenesis protein ResB [Verrucomicrobiota bacterium]
MVERIISFFTSLRLTVVCLCLAVLLVFIGTLAQVDEGLYQAQNRFFRSLLIYWSPAGSSWKIPVFPGGYLIGGVLLLNLIAAHLRRFKFSRKKIGILVVHSGLILLLLGQFMTDLFSTESGMRLTEGESKNYSESSLHNELAVINTSHPDHDRVVAIPESLLARPGEIQTAALPFVLRVKRYFPNSQVGLRAPMLATEPPPATVGAGTRLEVKPLPKVTDMDHRDLPSAVVEVLAGPKSLGTWLVSDWLDDPQSFTYDRQTYQLALRPVRYYQPFSLQLLKFSHDVYKGTEIPKDFSSRLRLRRPDTGEDREVLIYMNNPLRYAGETFYQASFDPKDPRVTILQVVHNPSWLTPYVSCGLVGAGLLIQFLTHLIGFAKQQTGRLKAAGRPGDARVPGRPAAKPVALAAAGASAVSSSIKRSRT